MIRHLTEARANGMPSFEEFEAAMNGDRSNPRAASMAHFTRLAASTAMRIGDSGLAAALGMDLAEMGQDDDASGNNGGTDGASGGTGGHAPRCIRGVFANKWAPAAVKSRLADEGVDAFDDAALASALKSNNPESALLMLDAGLLVTPNVLLAVTSSLWADLLLPTVFEKGDVAGFVLGVALVKCSTEAALLQLLEVGMKPTPRALTKMIKIGFFTAAAYVIKRDPAAGLARYKEVPAWFWAGYDFAKVLIPLRDLHTSTAAGSMTYLMFKLNQRHWAPLNLPLSADPAAGFDPNHRCELGGHVLTPLAVAASNDIFLVQLEEVRQLLAAGADPCVKLRLGRTALSYLGAGNLAVVQMLVGAGVSVAQRDVNGQLPIVQIATDATVDTKYSARMSIAMALLECMEPDDFTVRDLKQLAASASHCEILTMVVRWLIEAGSELPAAGVFDEAAAAKLSQIRRVVAAQMEA